MLIYTRPEAGAAEPPSTARSRRYRARKKAGRRLVTLELSEEHTNALVHAGFLPSDRTRDRPEIARAIHAAIVRACPLPPPAGVVRGTLELPREFALALVQLGWMRATAVGNASATRDAFLRMVTHAVQLRLRPTTSRTW